MNKILQKWSVTGLLRDRLATSESQNAELKARVITLESSLKAVTQERDTLEQRLEKRGSRALIVSVVTCVAAVATSLIYYFQLKEMVEATKATVQAVDVSRTQLDEVRRTRILDERAWISVIPPTGGEPLLGGFLRFKVAYENTGKTPAIGARILVLSAADINRIPKDDQPPNPAASSVLLFPKAPPVSGVIEPKVEDVKRVGAFYIYGTVWYDDIFRRHHWSQFCYLVHCDNNLNCVISSPPIHNSCDDAQD